MQTKRFSLTAEWGRKVQNINKLFESEALRFINRAYANKRCIDIKLKWYWYKKNAANFGFLKKFKQHSEAYNWKIRKQNFSFGISIKSAKLSRIRMVIGKSSNVKKNCESWEPIEISNQS